MYQAVIIAMLTLCYSIKSHVTLIHGLRSRFRGLEFGVWFRGMCALGAPKSKVCYNQMLLRQVYNEENTILSGLRDPLLGYFPYQ